MQFSTLMGSFCPNHIKFQLKKYRRMISHDTKHVFQIWHEGFGEFSPNHSKLWKFLFDGLFLSSVYKVSATKIQRTYLSWHWTVTQNLNKLWPYDFKNGMGNWVNFHQSTQKSEKCTLTGSFCPKHIMFQLENFIEIMCHDTETLQHLKKNWVVVWKMK